MTAVLAVVALAILLVPANGDDRLKKSADAAKIQMAKVQIRALQTGLISYRLDTSAFPSTQQGLKALVTAPKGVANWQGPYVKEIPLDPWGHAFAYKYPGDHGEEPDIISYGADGQAGGDGINADIVSWKNN